MPLDPAVNANPEEQIPKKTNRLRIIIGILIITILISFGLIYWFYHQYIPKTYSVVTFNSNQIYKLKSGDVLNGKGIPNSTVKILLSSKNSTEIKSNQKGEWSYKIPPNLKNGRQLLTIIIFDQAKKIAAIKSYTIEISNFLGKLKLGSEIKIISQVKAASQNEDGTNDATPGPDFYNWINEMHNFGIYPKIENGEVILYSKDAYLTKFCSNDHPCLFNQVDPIKEFTNLETQNKSFVIDLAQKLIANKYSPIALDQYFPEIHSTFDPNIEKAIDSYGFEKGDYQTQIDAATLSNLITEVRTERGYKNLKLPLGEELIVLSDPIFGTRSIIKWLTLPPNQVSNDERINAILGLSFIYGLSEKVIAKGIVLTADTAIDLLRASKDVKLFRSVIAEEGVLDYRVVQEGGNAWLVNSPLSYKNGGIRQRIPYIPTTSNSYGTVGRAEAWLDSERLLGESQFKPEDIKKGLYNPGKPPLPKGNMGAPMYNEILAAFKAGRGVTVSRKDVLVSAVANVKLALYRFQARTGRNLLPDFEKNLQRLAENGNAYVIGDEYFPEKYKMSGFYTGFQNYIVYRESSYFSQQGIGLVHHEITHMAGQRMRGFTYLGNTEKDKAFTAIYELMTDAWSDIERGINIFDFQNSGLQNGGYIRLYPNTYDFIFRLYKSNPKYLDDFLQFAIDGDADKLVGNIFSYQETTSFMDKLRGKQWVPNYDTFYTVLKARGINLQAVVYAPGVLAFKEAFGADNQPDSIDPAIETGPGFITNDNSDQQPTITITGIDGKIVAGGTVKVSAVVTNYGLKDFPKSEFSETWTIEPEVSSNKLVQTTFARESIDGIDQHNILVEGNSCEEACSAIIPSDLSSGKYRIKAYLIDTTSNQILNSDSQEIILTSAGGTNPVTKTGSSQTTTNPPPQTTKGLPITTCDTTFGPCPAGLQQLEDVFKNVISVVVGLGFIAMLVMLVVAGIKYLTSGGEPKAVQSAHNTVTWALLGVVFMAIAWLILQLIHVFTGIDVTVFNVNVLF